MTDQDTKQRNTGAMVALFIPPDVAQQIYNQVAPTLKNLGIEPEPVVDYHITLVFLGEAEGIDRETISATLKPFQEYPLVGQINGLGRFFAGNEETNALYLSLDCVELPGFRQQVIGSLQGAGFGLNQNHGFVPHITIGYIPASMPTPDVRVSPLMVVFQDYTLALGDDRLNFPIYEIPDYEPSFVTELDSDEMEPVRSPGMFGMRAVKEALARLFDGFKKHPAHQGFKVLPNGKWAAWYTNSFEDKEGEFFPEAAIDAYISRVDSKQVDPPDLWYYHIPGTRHGVAEWIGRIGHIVLAVGSFDSTEAGQAFMKGYQKTRKQHRVSHGYWFDPAMRVDGAYWNFDTFEISPLPMGKEANAVTTFVSLEGIKAMTVTTDKKNALAAIIGSDLAEKLLANTDAASKELETTGLKFKEATPPPTEAAPLVDTDARDAIKALAGSQVDAKALGEKLDTLITSLTGEGGLGSKVAGLSTELKALQDANKTQGERLGEMETLFKTMMELSPAASKNPQTVIPFADQYLQFLQKQNNNPAAEKAAEDSSVFGLMLSGLKQNAQEGK